MLGGTLEIVKNGEAHHLLHPDPGFEIVSQGSSVLLKDPRQTFLVNARPGDQFTLKIRMALEKADKSAAALVLGSKELSSHFLFAGSHGNFMRPGGSHFFLPKSSRQPEDLPTPQYILDGEMFDLELTYRRTGEDTADLTLSLNGEPFFQKSGKCPPVDTIGLRPWRSTGLIIESMTLEGTFEPGGVEAKFFEEQQP